MTAILDFKECCRINTYIYQSHLPGGIRSKSWCLIISFHGQEIQLLRFEKQEMAAILDFQDDRRIKTYFYQ